jgi:membrane-bound lytic murein transglycosylase A
MQAHMTLYPSSPATRGASATATIALGLLLAACATEPPPSTFPAPAPIATASAIAEPPAPVCPPPVEAPKCPEPKPEPPTPPEEPRGRIARVDWNALPGWRDDELPNALQAFIKGCDPLAKKPAWQQACAAAFVTPMDRQSVAAFFIKHFDPYQIVSATDDSPNGLVTGYYEPLLQGSRTPTKRFRYPVYGQPQDLLTIDLSSVYPDLKHRRLRGRIEGNKVVPYYPRADIDNGQEPLRGLEIAWVDDAVDLFFLQIQGSGQIQLENGERMRVGYADQNGHPFRSLGGVLIRRGEMKLENASMQGIKEWARRNPKRIQEFMNTNPSYVFFRELPRDLSGPLGSLGVPLTPERSLAVDPRVVPLGAPVYLSTTYPNSPTPLNRLMVAQDTGGAIAGAVRADFYWGFGDEAGQLAGRMKQTGNMWVLLPKGYDLTTLPPTVKVKQ